MGYGKESFRLVTDILLACGSQARRRRLLELGAQELNRDVPPSAVLRSLYLLNPVLERPQDIVRSLPGGFVSTLFEAADVDYSCIDLFDAEQVVKIDLNRADLPRDLHGRFDVVTNHGTSEHIFDQHRTFKAMHDAVRVGGVMVHAVPANGMFNHGFFKYQPKLFLYLAHANRYELVSWSVTAGGPDFMPVNMRIPGSQRWLGRDLAQSMLVFVLRKREADDFVGPTDLDLRYAPADFPSSLLEAAAPSTSESPVSLAARDPSPDDTPISASAATRPQDAFLAAIESIERWCDAGGLGVEPYVLAACMLKDELLERLSTVALGSAASQAVMDRLVLTAAHRSAGANNEPRQEINLGLGFLGSGWGRSGGDVYRKQARYYRSIGPSGTSSIFLSLEDDCDYRIDTLFFDASPGDAIRRFHASPGIEDSIVTIGEDIWHRCRVTRDEVRTRHGLVQIDYSIGHQDRVSLQRTVASPLRA